MSKAAFDKIAPGLEEVLARVRAWARSQHRAFTPTQHELIHELQGRDPGTWVQFDPPFHPRTIAALVRAGLIEARGHGRGQELRLRDPDAPFSPEPRP